MNPQTLSLQHLITLPRQPTVQPPVAVLLHGVGSDEHALLKVLGPALDPRFLTVSVRAPYSLQPRGYGWFHVEFSAQGPRIQPEEAEESRRNLLAFIPELLQAYPLDAQRVFLVGFSQGAILTASVALSAPPGLIAGTAMLSGRVLPELSPHLAPPEHLRQRPFFVAHGRGDATLPIHHARATRISLANLGVNQTYLEYEAGHEIVPAMLTDLRLWHAALLERKSAVA